MSRSEQRAEEWARGLYALRNEPPPQFAFQQGYEQAESDLDQPPVDQQRLIRIREMNQMRREMRATSLSIDILDDIDYLLSHFPATGAEKCVKCGHSDGIDKSGYCVKNSGTFIRCGCKCVFSTTSAARGQLFKDFLREQLKDPEFAKGK